MPPDFIIEVFPNWYEGVTVLKPQGRFESRDSARYLQEVLKLESRNDIIVDISNVSRLEQICVDVFTDGYINSLATGKMFKLCGLQEQPLKILGARNNLGVFVAHETVDEAAAAMTGPTRNVPPKLIAVPAGMHL